PYLWNPDPEDPYFKGGPGLFRAELHRRLTEWTFPLVYGLVALVLAGDARSHREKRISPVVLAFTLAFLLRWLSFYISNQAARNGDLIPVMYVVPILAGGGALFMMLRSRQLRRSRFNGLADGLLSAFAALRLKRKTGGTS
ncbi:MAG: LptF/LptG family permease, partial [Gammaproteobacteria bacterium]